MWRRLPVGVGGQSAVHVFGEHGQDVRVSVGVGETLGVGAVEVHRADGLITDVQRQGQERMDTRCLRPVGQLRPPRADVGQGHLNLLVGAHRLQAGAGRFALCDAGGTLNQTPGRLYHCAAEACANDWDQGRALRFVIRERKESGA